MNLLEPVYDYDKFISDTRKLTQQYQGIIKHVTIGRSHDNRDIVMLGLGIGSKFITCVGGVHGRETINPIVLMKIIEYYAELYTNYKRQKQELFQQLSGFFTNLISEYEQMIYGSCIYELLQTYTILFVPLLNPDGYMISLLGYDSIRNEELRLEAISKDELHTEWKYNGRGIDINRNFPSRLWRPKGTQDHPASEHETRALIKVFHQYKSEGFLDFHSRGKSIYYYRSMMSDIYNERQLRIANKLQEITNYELVPPQDEVEAGDSGGNTVHYYSERFYKTALTIETVDDDADFPLDVNYRLTTFEELKLVIFKFGSLII
ncbi:hypothetical protein I5677_11250 [Mobilitalea sibirica]|uniref:Peptidase M14 domain-containing protein n=1 Tax=Mobilitalea sibirica TaxID=1462919 RepID=A0A8J7GZT2_9FIRM|nr:hypothetical protein [Mobilitalea sibirica]